MSSYWLISGWKCLWKKLANCNGDERTGSEWYREPTGNWRPWILPVPLRDSPRAFLMSSSHDWSNLSVRGDSLGEFPLFLRRGWLASVTPPASTAAGRITTHMRNVTELPARMDARWDFVSCFFFRPPRLPPAPAAPPPAGAAAGLIDEDWGAGTSGAGRTPPRNSIQPVNWIQLSDQPYQRKAYGFKYTCTGVNFK